MQLASAMFERIGILDEELVKNVLFNIFTIMHFYRNNTKKQVIPIAITRSIHIFFSTFIINFGVDRLVSSCD